VTLQKKGNLFTWASATIQTKKKNYGLVLNFNDFARQKSDTEKITM